MLQKGKSKGGTYFGLTQREQARIEAVIDQGSYEKACIKLGIKLSTIRQSLYRVREKYEAAKKFTNQVEQLSRRLKQKTGKKYL